MVQRSGIDTIKYHTWWESDKLTEDTTNESQDVSPFPAGDHKHTKFNDTPVFSQQQTLIQQQHQIHFYALERTQQPRPPEVGVNIFYIKERNTARIKNRYNQVPHLSQDTKWDSNKITINIKNKNQEVSPFPPGYHKAAINRRESMTNTRHK